MKVLGPAAVAWLLFAACGRAPGPLPPEAAPLALSSDGDRTFYAVGLVAARGLEPFEMNERELQIVMRGFDDATTGKEPAVDLDTYGPRIDVLEKTRKAADGAAARSTARILDRAAREPNAARAASGFVLQTLTPGTGPSPTLADGVRVVFFGMLPEGVIFEGSPLDRDARLVSLASATECWRQALPTMRAGQKGKLFCPPALAYGDRGRPPHVPGGAVVVFELELVEVVKGDRTAGAARAGDGRG